MNCEECVFNTNSLDYTGDIESDFVIISDGPSPVDLAKKQLFSQKDVRDVFSAAFEKSGSMSLDNCLIIPAYRCMPQKKDPKKLAKACKACREHVLEIVKRHPRKTILGIGNPGLWFITGNYDLRITKERGKEFETDLCETKATVTYAPNYILRGGGNMQQFTRDIQIACELYGVDTKLNSKVLNKFVEGKYRILTTKEEVNTFADYLHKLPEDTFMGIDLETDGFNPRNYPVDPPYTLGVGIICAGFSLGKNKTAVIPGNLLCNRLFTSKVKQCYHNGKYDIAWLWKHGFRDAQVHHDSMLMSYLLDERGGIHDLEQVGNDWLSAPNYKDMLEKYLPTRKHSYANIPTEELYHYQAIDTQLTQELCMIMYPEIAEDPALSKAYDDVIIPGSYFLSRMEENGIYLDIDRVNENIEKLGEEANRHEIQFREISATYGITDINLRSPKQIQTLLADKLHLIEPGGSTDAKTLEQLPSHPAVDSLKAYRKVHKLLSTFVKPLKEKQENGRLHSTFKLHGTMTGRLSSNKPNLQNIPRDLRIRNQFGCRPGYVIVDCDLSQAELRVLACLSNDREMISIFLEGRSLHDEVATDLFGSGFNKEQKMIAKNINFGIIYGITAYGLRDQIEIKAKALGSNLSVSNKEASEWIKGWYAKFPDAANFINACRAIPTNRDTIVTPFGRKRRFTYCGKDKLYALQNEAANFPEQSTAHDITFVSGIRLIDQLQNEYDARIVNEVHDCLLIETPDNMRSILNVAKLVTDTMRQVPKDYGLTQVPFVSEPAICYNWGSDTTLDLSEMNRVDTIGHLTFNEYLNQGV